MMELGLYSEAVGMAAEATACVYALSIAAEIEDDQARTFLREIAMDRSRSGPSPNARSFFACCYGKCQQDEARALTSIRLIALAFLNDKSLARAIARDHSESGFIRKWAGAMAEGGEGTMARMHRKRQREQPSFWVSPCPPNPDGP